MEQRVLAPMVRAEQAATYSRKSNETRRRPGKEGEKMTAPRRRVEKPSRLARLNEKQRDILLDMLLIGAALREGMAHWKTAYEKFLNAAARPRARGKGKR